MAMDFLDAPSNKSCWQGLDYYRGHKVLTVHEVEPRIYEGQVSGSESAVYDVRIDVEHPRRSTCTCPFANGRHVVCKHQVAAYFEVVPGSDEQFERDAELARQEYELELKRWEEQEIARIRQYVKGLSAKEARDRLAEMMMSDALYSRNRW